MTAPLIKDMAITPEDFVRLLPRAVKGWHYSVEGLKVEVGATDQGVSITIVPQEARRLGGLMVLPRSQVSLVFRGFSDAEREEFLRQFDLSYQRGGG